MSFDQTEWVWIDGEYVRWVDASVHIATHTLHLGSGVFEAVRCYQTETGPAVFRLDAHIDRLFASAAVYNLEIPYTRQQLAEAICETVRLNNFEICYIRVLCYLGVGSLGVSPRNCPVHLAILSWPLGAYLGGAEVLEKGVRVTISSWTKFHSRMMPTTAKACGQYLNSILAMREAIERGFDEGILLDIDGNIAEGSGENIFIVRDGRLITNDEQSSILLGITREAVIEIARDLGFEVEVRKLRVEDLYSADEAFFTGTAAEVTPIREVDGTLIGKEARGPVTTLLQQHFFAATSGRDPKYTKWLQFIEPKVDWKTQTSAPGVDVQPSLR